MPTGKADDVVHPSLGPLRLYAYALALGEAVDGLIASHLAICPDCQFLFTVLRETDPLLAGEDAVRTNALIREARANVVDETSAFAARMGN
jgi:hypothetical protein